MNTKRAAEGKRVWSRVDDERLPLKRAISTLLQAALPDETITALAGRCAVSTTTLGGAYNGTSLPKEVTYRKIASVAPELLSYVTFKDGLIYGLTREGHSVLWDRTMNGKKYIR